MPLMRDEDDEALRLMRALQARKIGFAGIPEHCGAEAELGGEDPAGWREWTDIQTTADQRRIEDWLLSIPTEGKSILHIGVGNSSLAKRLSSHVRQIVGTTIYEGERGFGEGLQLRNYAILSVNKFSRDMARLGGKFDFIVDNNPASYACCLFHFCRMMRAYRSLLEQGGELLTAEPGLGMVLPGRDSGWALDWEQWGVLAEILGLRAEQRTATVYAMTRGETSSPRCDRSPAPASDKILMPPPRASPEMSARLARLIGKLTLTQEALSGLVGDPGSAQARLAALFALPAANAPRRLAPYEEISPGVCVGFPKEIAVSLSIERKTDDDASPKHFVNRLKFSFVGRGWFSLEIRVAAEEFVGAVACQVALCANANRPLGCRMLLRWRQDGSGHEAVLQDFRLHPQERNHNFCSWFASPQADSDRPVGGGLVVALFDAGTDVELVLDYANLYFA